MNTNYKIGQQIHVIKKVNRVYLYEGKRTITRLRRFSVESLCFPEDKTTSIYDFGNIFKTEADALKEIARRNNLNEEMNNGSYVRIIGGHPKRIGELARVSSINENAILIKLAGENYFYNPDELRVIETKFKVGDVVVIKKQAIDKLQYTFLRNNDVSQDSVSDIDIVTQVVKVYPQRLRYKLELFDAIICEDNLEPLM